MTNPIKINLNEMVKVQIKPRGLARLKDHYQDLVKHGLPAAIAEQLVARHQPDAEGYTEMQFHEVMRMFGDLLDHDDLPIDLNIIISQATL